MLKIVVIGAGNHSSRYHLPALKEYNRLKPGKIELTALCDLNRKIVEDAGSEFGFVRTYTDYEEMIRKEKPNACIAITPIEHTKSIVSKIIPTGVPLLMEKPLGASINEANEICSAAEKYNSHIMVSVNRRFNPLLNKAVSYLSGRPIEYIRAVMLRHNRTESEFFYTTALHSVDLMRYLAVSIIDYEVKTRNVKGVNWYTVNLKFGNGGSGLLEVIPNCGYRSETYELFGADYCIKVDVTEDRGGKVILRGNDEKYRKQELPVEPKYFSNGTYNETEEFISSIIEKRKPEPAPADVLKSMEICMQIQKEYGIR